MRRKKYFNLEKLGRPKKYLTCKFFTFLNEIIVAVKRSEFKFDLRSG